MRFASPYWLLLLAVIPTLVLFYIRAVRGRDEAISRLVSYRLRSALVLTSSGRRRWTSYILVLSGLFLIIAALARPQFGQRPGEKERMGVDIEFMIDSSLSMSAVDVAPNRFEAAKAAVSEIMKNLKGDRVGLSLFTNASLRVLPFTTDYASLEYFLKIADMKVFLYQGTNMESALKEAIPAFDRKSKKSKVVAVLSDGEDEPGVGYRLPEDFATADLRVFAFGIGTESGGPIPVRSETNEIVGYMKYSNGKEIVTRLEEEPLKKMAGAFRGKYYRYSKEGVESFIRDLDHLKREMIEEKEEMVYVDYFQFFLVAGFLMLFIGKAVSED